MTCPRGVTFDGANDYLLRGVPTGLVNGRQGSFSSWAKIDSGGTIQKILGTANHFTVVRDDSNRIAVQVTNAAVSAVLIFQTTASYATSGWINILASWDTNFPAGNKLHHLYVSDTNAESSAGDGQAAFDIDYQEGNYGVGGFETAGSPEHLFDGDLADVWFTNEYIDFSVQGNRRKFIGPTGGALDLGVTGQLPTGTAAKVYQRGPASAFAANLGTGGNFTVTGALTDSADDPLCDIPVIPGILMGDRLRPAQAM